MNNSDTTQAIEGCRWQLLVADLSGELIVPEPATPGPVRRNLRVDEAPQAWQPVDEASDAKSPRITAAKPPKTTKTAKQ
jgi:hypothetical protein